MSLGGYSLGAYNLALLILDRAVHLPEYGGLQSRGLHGRGGYSLKGYNLALPILGSRCALTCVWGGYSLGVYSLALPILVLSLRLLTSYIDWWPTALGPTVSGYRFWI